MSKNAEAKQLKEGLRLIQGGKITGKDSKSFVEGKIEQMNIELKSSVSAIRTASEAVQHFDEEGNEIQKAFWQGRLSAHKKVFNTIKGARDSMLKSLK